MREEGGGGERKKVFLNERRFPQNSRCAKAGSIFFYASYQLFMLETFYAVVAAAA